MEIIKLNIEEIKPYKNNAKIHTLEQIEQIKKSIQEFGFNDPIAIQGKENLVVEGHGRLLAVKELGYKEVDCIRLDHLTDEERKLYSLGRTEMFGREFVYEKSVDKFELILKKLDLTLEYRTTSNGSIIPDKAMVVYFNLNPTSTIKAYQAFQEEMNKELFLLLNNIDNTP